MSASDLPQVQDLYSELKDARIVMVDDEPVLMEILEAFLEERGYENLTKIEDSRTALATLEEDPPDVLLLDLKMPHVDGFEILQGMRESRLLERIPVIVLTSSTDAETKLRALEIGATDFLAKPVDSSELALRLRNILTVKAYQDHLTYYDSLTHLANRRLFIDRLEWLLKKSKRDPQRLAVMDISLDGFKQVNDSYGPAVGDEVLKEVAARMVASVRDSDVVSRVGTKDLWHQLARLGGDEFSILLHGLQLEENAAFVASRIHEAIERKIEIDGHEVYITASIGIALHPQDGEGADSLISNAGAASAHARQIGRSQYQFFSKEISARYKERLNLEAALRNAIDQEEFELHYQPKIDLKTGAVKGCEALVRWNNPELGLVYPDRFVPVAEEAGLIVPIGDWILQEACRQQVEWSRQGLGELIVAVNVAGIQFGSKGFRNTVREAFESISMDPAYLKLEITESTLMSDAETAINKLNDIRSDGPTFSIDDFGTGYSSLSYLKRFPINELKIDRSFVIDLPASSDDGAIVKAIIAMAHHLGLTVVAEGVEEVGQLEFLRALDCDMVQGYHFSKPLAKAEFTGFVRAHVPGA